MMQIDSRSPGWHPLAKDALLAAWLTLAGNLPLWLRLLRLPEAQSARGLWLLPGMASLLLASLLLVFTLLMWAPWRRGLGALLLAGAGLGSYFMASFGIVIDPGMVSNVFHTDVLEAQGLLTLPLLGALLVGVALPVLWWWRAPVRPVPWPRLLWQRGLLASVAAIAATVLLLGMYQDLASLMRNHKSLRYMINPYNTVYAVLRQGLSETAQAAQVLHPIGLDAQARAETDPQQAPVIVLVVGETARAANFGVGGYPRDTTPRLSALAARGELSYFTHVQSCGTSTQVSVPCMFSRQGRPGLGGPPEENVLDLLQRAGLAVRWVENQSGCKGVCDRVPHVRADELAPAGACQGAACPDAVLPQLVEQLLPTLDAQQRLRGSVIVLHQIGNHGPAYFERSQAARKAFLPECGTRTLSSCEPQAIVNAYDNAIRETDAMLGDLIDRLARLGRPAAMLYLSDHGESLGENGLYLHGMPWSLAPDVQKQVPMALWLSPGMRERLQTGSACLATLTARPWSHDNLFHTLAGLAGVSSVAIDPTRDILARCEPADAMARTGTTPSL